MKYSDIQTRRDMLVFFQSLNAHIVKISEHLQLLPKTKQKLIDIETALYLVSKAGHLLVFLPIKYKKNKDVVITAIKTSPSIIYYNFFDKDNIDKYIDDYDLALYCVTQIPELLEFIPKKYWSDKLIVSTAIKMRPMIMSFRFFKDNEDLFSNYLTEDDIEWSIRFCFDSKDYIPTCFKNTKKISDAIFTIGMFKAGYAEAINGEIVIKKF